MTQNGKHTERPGKTDNRPPARSGLLPLHEAAMRLAGMGLNRSHGKTRDIVAMLLGHGARAWRTGQPEIIIHLHVVSPQGRSPIKLRTR